MDNKGLMEERRHIQATTTTNRCVRIWPVEYDGGIDMITVMFTSRVRAAMEQQGGVVVILEVIQEVKEWSTYMVSYYHTLLSRVHTCSSRSSSITIWITCLPPGTFNTACSVPVMLIPPRMGCPVSPPSTPTTWPAMAGARWSPFLPMPQKSTLPLYSKSFPGSIIRPDATPTDTLLKEIIHLVLKLLSGGRRPTNIHTSCGAHHQPFFVM